MSSKRDHDDVDEGEVSEDEPTPKRAKRHTGAQPRHHHQSSAVDPTWGQKYVFSNSGDATTIPYGEESDFEDDADAMAYLRSVRLESNGIPHLLIAPTRGLGPQLPPNLERQILEDFQEDAYTEQQRDLGEDAHAVDLDDEKAYYDDGAYIARPSESEDDDDDSEDARRKELHDAYFASTLTRYRALRRVLHSRPPPNAAKRLSSARPTHAGALDHNPATARKWAGIVRAADPHPLQLALMDKDTVLRVLRVMLGGKLLRGGYTLTERTSRWLWGLLARLPDPWELDHAETASIRDLGRRAVLLGRSLAEMAALRAELEDEVLGFDEGGEDADIGNNTTDDADEFTEREGLEESEQMQKGPNGAVKDEDALTPNAGDRDNTKEETDSVAMDLSSDSGECSETEPQEPADARKDDDDDALEAAKRALLSSLNSGPAQVADKDKDEDKDEDDAELARLRLRMNMRATLNMILTVAGEFYGQRDLLEFREPFVGL